MAERFNSAKLQVLSGFWGVWSLWPSCCHFKKMNARLINEICDCRHCCSHLPTKKKQDVPKQIYSHVFSSVFMWSTSVFLALLRPWHLSRLVSPRSWEISQLRLGVPGGPYPGPLQRRHDNGPSKRSQGAIKLLHEQHLPCSHPPTGEMNIHFFA